MTEEDDELPDDIWGKIVQDNIWSLVYSILLCVDMYVRLYYSKT